jgi:hypothetical protein
LNKNTKKEKKRSSSASRSSSENENKKIKEQTFDITLFHGPNMVNKGMNAVHPINHYTIPKDWMKGHKIVIS